MKRKALREYPWGLSEFEADTLISLVANRGYGTIVEALADIAFDNGQDELCNSLRQAAINLSEVSHEVC